MEAETCKKELVIEIPADVVRREVEKVTNHFRRVARIPGFRPGHARTALIRQHFRADIQNEVAQSLIPRFFDTAVKEQNLTVVGRPRFDDLKFEDDQPLTCKATFEVVPEFELGEYKGLEVDEEPATIDEAAVDAALENIRERAATFEVVTDRPAADGDYVYVSYEGRNVKDSAKAPIEARDAVVHLGGEGTVAAFTENLRGVNPGETREFEVSYPDDFAQESLAGQTVRYRTEVQSIKKKVVPPLDDDLAKSVSESETLAALRAEVRTSLETDRKRQVENAAQKKLLGRLIEQHDFKAPEALVEAQLDRKLERIVTQLMAQGIDPRKTEVDWRKVREESRPEAEKEVRGSLILGKIAKAESIEVSDEEVDEMVRDLAAERRETPAALKTRLTQEGALGTIRSTRRSQKALEIIYRSAKIIRKSE